MALIVVVVDFVCAVFVAVDVAVFVVIVIARDVCAVCVVCYGYGGCWTSLVRVSSVWSAGMRACMRVSMLCGRADACTCACACARTCNVCVVCCM